MASRVPLRVVRALTQDVWTAEQFLIKTWARSVSWSGRPLFVAGCFPATAVVVYRLPESSKLLCWIQWLCFRFGPSRFRAQPWPRGLRPALRLLSGLAGCHREQNHLEDRPLAQCVFPEMMIWGKSREISRLLCKRQFPKMDNENQS